MKMSPAYQRQILALAGQEAPARKTVVAKDAGLAPFQLHTDLGSVGGSWSVTIDGWQPTLLNTLLNVHPMARGRLKGADALRIGAELLGAGVPRATVRRRVTFQVTLGPRQRTAPDHDAWWKSLLDGLVNCGALVDDSPAWVERDRDQPYLRGPRKATTITLTDLI